MYFSRVFRKNSFYQSLVNSQHNRCLRNSFCPSDASSRVLLFLSQPSAQLSPACLRPRLGRGCRPQGWGWKPGAVNKYVKSPVPRNASAPRPSRSASPAAAQSSCGSAKPRQTPGLCGDPSWAQLTVPCFLLPQSLSGCPGKTGRSF